MNLITDALLAAGAFGAALYCYILQGRLQRFTALESGMGGAIAVLSAQVDDMTRALQAAQGTAGQSSATLEAQVARAEAAAAKLVRANLLREGIIAIAEAGNNGPAVLADRIGVAAEVLLAAARDLVHYGWV